MALNNMVLIQGGTFEMGATEEQIEDWNNVPVHQVTLDSYYISKYTVTFEQYDAFCETTGRKKPSDEDWGRGKRPVIYVNWYDAVEYCNWLSEQFGLTPCYQIDKSVEDANNKTDRDKLKWAVQCDFGVDGFRLPTEAEWEYAARGRGQKIRFGNGKNTANPKEMNFYSPVVKHRKYTVLVDSLTPNILGLYNMSGNVWEWCWDWHSAYSSEPVRNPKGASSGTSRVLRGGSWGNDAEYLEVSDRISGYPDRRNRYLGFRLARTFIEN